MELNNKKSVIIGQSLKKYRLKYKESQGAFAERIHCAQTTLSKYEKDGITNIDTIIEISEKLGVNLLLDSDDDLSNKERILSKVYHFYISEKNRNIGELMLTKQKLKDLTFGLNQNILDRILISLTQDGLIRIIKNIENENDTTEFILMTALGILRMDDDKDFPKDLSADIIQLDVIKKEFSNYENGHFIPMNVCSFNFVRNEIDEKSTCKLHEFVDAKEYQGKFEDFDNPENNIQLSEHIAVKTDYTIYNGNILLIGEEQKDMLKRNLTNNNSSFVVFDTNDSLIRETGKALKEKGYEIRVLNLVDLKHSNNYNPFSYLKNNQDVSALADIVSNSTESDENSVNTKIKSLLLQALIFYLIKNPQIPKEEGNFTNVMKLLQAAEVNENDPNAQSPLDKLFAQLEAIDSNSIAVKQYKAFKSLARNQVSQIVAFCMQDLSAITFPEIANLTSSDNLDLSSIGDSKVALFIILPPGNGSYDFIATILYTQLINVLYSHACNDCPCSYNIKNGDEVLAVIYGSSDEYTKKLAQKTLLSLKRSPIKFLRTKNKYVIKVMTYSKTFDSKDEAIEFKSKLEGASICIGNSRLPYDVKIIINHSVSKSIFKGLSKHLTYISKSGINYMVSVNGIFELRSSFKQEWETIVANCDIQLFSAVKDTETASYLLSKTGTANFTSFPGFNTCFLFINHVKPIIDKIFLKKTKPTEEYNYKKDIITLEPLKTYHCEESEFGYNNFSMRFASSKRLDEIFKDNNICTIRDAITKMTKSKVISE